MKISGFEPLSLCDYPGIPASVVFTQGCNWRCPYCHNKSLLSFCREALFSKEEILETIAERSDFIEGVVITGGEPTEQDKLTDFIKELRCLDLKVKLDTNGSNPAVLESLLEERLVDYVAMDIKAPYAKYDLVAGCSVQQEMVKKSISILSTADISHHFRTTYSEKYLNQADLFEIKDNLPQDSRHVIQEMVER